MSRSKPICDGGSALIYRCHVHSAWRSDGRNTRKGSRAPWNIRSVATLQRIIRAVWVSDVGAQPPRAIRHSRSGLPGILLSAFPNRNPRQSITSPESYSQGEFIRPRESCNRFRQGPWPMRAEKATVYHAGFGKSSSLCFAERDELRYPYSVDACFDEITKPEDRRTTVHAGPRDTTGRLYSPLRASGVPIGFFKETGK